MYKVLSAYEKYSEIWNYVAKYGWVAITGSVFNGSSLAQYIRFEKLSSTLLLTPPLGT